MKGAIFDLDGTLIDSMGIWKDLGRNYLLSYNIVPALDLEQKLATMTLEEAAKDFQKTYRIEKEVEEILREIDDQIREFYHQEVTLKEGVLELLEYLSETGIPMVIATSTRENLVEGTLKHTGIAKYFQRVFTCEQVGTGKKNPKIYLEAAKFLKGKMKIDDLNEIYVFEDAAFAMKTAKKAGFYVVGVYDESQEEPASKIATYCHTYVTSLNNRESIVHV